MYGKQGIQTLAAGGSGPLRLTSDGSLVVLESGGKYKDAALAGRLFSVANQAAVSTTAALATTWTGLGICNPTASGKNIIVYEFGFAQLAAGVAGGIGLMSADTTGFTTASLAPKPAMYGTASSIAYTSAGATIGTPILYRVFGSVGSLATTGYAAQGPYIIQLDGSIILPPGRSLLTYTTAACTTAFAFHFLWEEVDD